MANEALLRNNIAYYGSTWGGDNGESCCELSVKKSGLVACLVCGTGTHIDRV